MTPFASKWTTAVWIALSGSLASAGPLDPDCTAEKAAKSAATKATVGVGGRCSAGEAAKDTAKKTVGIDDKKSGPLDKGGNGNQGAVGAIRNVAK